MITKSATSSSLKRAVDTRGDASYYNTKSPLQTGGSRNYQLAGITINGVSIPANAKALTGNIQVAQPSEVGYLTVYPGPADPTAANWPVASNMVYNSGEYLSNALILNLGSDGTANFYAFKKTDVVVDITGYYLPYVQNPTGGLFYYSLNKQIRLLDTRPGTSGNNTGSGSVLNGSTRNFTLTGMTYNGITIPTSAKVLDGTVVATSASTGYLTFYPGPSDTSGVNRPVSTNLIFQAARYLANSSKMLLGADGTLNIYAFQTSDITLDVAGYFA